MIIKIGSQEYKYEPGFSPQSETWKHRLSWYTPNPQRIGPYQCFVKRFEEQPTGWELARRLSGQEDTGIPKVLATAIAQEGGKPAFYLFQEFFSGKTLKKSLKEGISLNGKQLLDEIWKGLNSIHANNYWHTDFNEENIFYSDEHGRFYLIDIDSAEPVSVAPSQERNTPGYVINQEGAIAAMRFIKDHVDPELDAFQPFGGMLLNQLQLIILLAKMDILRTQDRPLSSKEVRTLLSGHLKSSGDIAQRYIATAWTHRETTNIFSLPVVRTILQHHFPELQKNVLIRTRK